MYYKYCGKCKEVRFSTKKEYFRMSSPKCPVCSTPMAKGNVKNDQDWGGMIERAKKIVKRYTRRRVIEV